MRMKAGRKHIFICLLLCALFLTSYITVFNNIGIIPSEANLSDVSFGSEGNGHSSMDGGTNFRHFAYIDTGTSIEFYNFSSIKNKRSLVAKTNFNILTALIAAQLVCLIYSSRLPKNICTQFNSIRIIYFLHKKDGMK